MAWIKLRTDLLNDPAVYRLAADLKTDRYSVVGRLAAFWGWADQHAVDGAVDGASSLVVDDVVSMQGFAEALQRVKWLVIEADRVVIPNHDRHNGANAKERALKSERQAKWRAGKAPETPPKPVDGPPSTREEKRREEKRDTGASKSRPSLTLKTYLQQCREAGTKPVPDDHAVRAYCRDAGIADEMLQVAWCVFREDYTAGTNKDKRYKDWPGHFHNAVKGCWAKLWYSDAGEVKWSSRGLQEKTVLEARMKAKEEAHAA